MLRLGSRLCLLVSLVLVPGLAHAQEDASITGVVRDASGAVMPGVTVEASSPILIEKVRSVVTDDTGQYRIVNLRPGTYDVVFSLTGFSTVRREGVELTGSFTATVNADMRVGALEETITVTSETPIVDIQSVRRQATIDGDVLKELPAARAYGAVMVLIPAIITQAGSTADVQVTPNMTVFGGSGGRGNEGRMQLDGLNTGASLNGAGVSTYIPDIGNAQEVSFTTSGGLGEAEVGGPTISVVPRTGGNEFRGSVFVAGVSSGMVGNNYTDELRQAGLSTPGKLLKLWDVNVGIGGPIKRDKLWFFAMVRDEGRYNSIPGIFPNRNAGDATKWTYDPDRSRQAQGAESWRIASARLTYQATPRNKFTFFWDEQDPCNGATYSRAEDGCRQQPESGAVIGSLGLGGLTATTSPETAGYLDSYQRVQQASWTSPVTSRLLLEAGVGTYLSRWGPYDMPGNPTRDLIRVVEQCAGGCPANGGIPNLTYRSANWLSAWNGSHTWRASASYVTGAHNMKFGYQGAFHVDERTAFRNSANLTYRLNNGIPNLITQELQPYLTRSRVRYDAFYGQDQWTLGRITLQGALRFDHAWSWFPEQQVGPTNFLPTALVFEKSDGVNYKNITPRAGVVYDLFGNGKTSLKVNIGKYLEPASNGNGNYSTPNPTSRIAGGQGQPAVTRSWIDANANFVADCNLLNPAAQDLRTSGGDSCGALNNQNFGTTRFSDRFEPELLSGWGVRPTDWGFGASIQHEVLPRISVEVGYFRRWQQNFTVTDNDAVKPSDFTEFSITAPSDPRLPNGGGYVISGLYDVAPNLFGITDTLRARETRYGKQYSRYNGVLINFTARPRNGLTVQGGINTGSTVEDRCDIRDDVPELLFNRVGQPPGSGLSPTNPYCHNAPGWVTRITGLASYNVPKVDVIVATTFRSDQGDVLRADYNVPAAVVAQTLGRAPAGGLANLTVNLVAPGEVWGDRVNELDLRFAKQLRFGRTRTLVGIDIYNVLNSSAVLTYNQFYVPNGSWLAPTLVLTPRFLKLSATFDF